METITKQTSDQKRLAQLHAESENIIDTYLKQVATNANAAIIKTLQSRLKEVRAEQWQLFNKTAPLQGNITRLQAAA